MFAPPPAYPELLDLLVTDALAGQAL